MADDAAVRVQALDGTWETLGADRARGILPENVSLSSNPWGSDKASFDLRRDPGSQWPDLSAFTPVEVEIGGRKVWSGRILETPQRDGEEYVVNVQAEGWQYHLDDDPFPPFYVHDDLGKWQDTRANPYIDLTPWPASAQLSSDGHLVAVYPSGATVLNGKALGFTLDLGPNRVARAASVDAEFLTTNSPSDRIIVRGHDTRIDMWGPNVNDAFWLTAPWGPGVFSGAFANPHRFVTIMFYRDGGVPDYAASTSLGSGMRIRAARIYAETKYESGGQSNLRASDVVSDAVSKGAPQLTYSEGGGSVFAEAYANGSRTFGAWLFRDDSSLRGGFAGAINVQKPGDDILSSVAHSAAGILINQPDPRGGFDAFYYPGTNGLAGGSTTNPNGSTNTGDWAMEVVFKPDTLPQGFGTVLRNGDTASGVSIGVGSADASGSNLVILYEAVRWIDTGLTLQSGRWYHVLLKRIASSGRTEVWVNGVLQYSDTAAAPNASVAANARVMVGADTAGNTRPFKGWVHYAAVHQTAPPNEVALYKAALGIDGSINRTDFSLPDLSPEDYRTSREVIEAVNVFHNWVAKVDVEKNVIFKPRPTTAEFAVGSWGGSRFVDASANSGEELYERVIVEANDAADNKLAIERIAAQAGLRTQYREARLNVAAASGNAIVSDSTRPLKKGVPYAVRLRTLAASAAGVGVVGTWRVRLGTLTDYVEQTISTPFVGPGILLVWRPAADTTDFGVAVTQLTGTAANSLQANGQLFISGSLPFRRGFQRTKLLPVSAAITLAAGEKIGDAYLSSHITTPLKGSLEIDVGGARNMQSGENVHPSEFLTATAEKIHLSHRIDPDTGAVGRDGTIASVSYAHNDRRATVEIDNTRRNFEALLERYSAVASKVK